MREQGRRTAALVFMVGLMVPLAFAGPVGAGADDADEFVTGSGRADARVLRFGPSSAQLGLTPSVALSLADFLGTVGRAESRAFDWAALAGTFEELEDHYTSSRVEARDEPEQEEERSNPPLEHHAHAWDTPRGESTTHLLHFEIPGVLEMSGGRAHAFAGLTTIDGEPFREAGGVAVIDELVFFGGEGILRGLRWEMVQRTDADGKVQIDGSFVIGEGVFGGETYQGPLGPEEAEPLLTGMNEAFAPTGLRLDPPELSRGGGDSGRMSPLSIRIIDSEVGNRTIAPVLGESQPLRGAVVDPFLEECPDCANAVLIADVGIGVLSGAGRLDVQLGGVFGITEGERFDDPFAEGFEAPGFEDTRQVVEEVVEVAPAAPRRAAGSPPSVVEDEPSVLQPPLRDGATPVRESGVAEALSGAWAAAVVGASTALGLAATGYRRLRLRRLGLPMAG